MDETDFGDAEVNSGSGMKLHMFSSAVRITSMRKGLKLNQYPSNYSSSCEFGYIVLLSLDRNYNCMYFCILWSDNYTRTTTLPRILEWKNLSNILIGERTYHRQDRHLLRGRRAPLDSSSIVSKLDTPNLEISMCCATPDNQFLIFCLKAVHRCLIIQFNSGKLFL